MPSCLNHTLTHPLAWEEPGVGTLALTHSQIPPLQLPNTWPQCLCGNRLDTPPSPPTLDTPSLESITPSESPESGYEADSD